ncbi:MAG: photosynthetic complex assembly protein PuhC [Pseudomonadota bacterium]
MPRAKPDQIPRPLFYGVCGLVLLTLTAVSAARIAGMEPVGQPPALSGADTRVAMTLAPLAGGGTEVLDPETGEVRVSLATGKDGFVRGIMRALGHRRGLEGVPKDAPVELLAFPNGHLTLLDPATGWRAELRSFGSDNLATFANLMSDMTDRREDAL